MKIATQPIPVVTLAPPADAPPERTRALLLVRPIIATAVVISALVFLYCNWATVLTVLALATLAVFILLLPFFLILRLVFGGRGLTGGAVLGAIAAALLIRRR